MSDDGSQYLLHMFAILRSRYAIQAVRPTRHWWQCPRGLAWFRVLMVWSLVKPSACAEPLSRIGDYLRAARGPGLLLQIKKRTAFPHECSPTRCPPYPLFHRRRKPTAVSPSNSTASITSGGSDLVGRRPAGMGSALVMTHLQGVYSGSSLPHGCARPMPGSDHPRRHEARRARQGRWASVGGDVAVDCRARPCHGAKATLPACWQPAHMWAPPTASRRG
jgi:hypothetical protein